MDAQIAFCLCARCALRPLFRGVQRAKPPVRALKFRIHDYSSYQMWRFLDREEKDGFSCTLARTRLEKRRGGVQVWFRTR